MAHKKVYVICEDKCWEEGMTKEQTQTLFIPTIRTSEPDTQTHNLGLVISSQISETVYTNAISPETVTIGGTFEDWEYTHVKFRFNKSAGMLARPSEYISLTGDMEGMDLVFLNDAINTTNYTRIYLDVFVYDGAVYIEVTGC